MILSVFLLFVAAISFSLTWVMRRYAIANNVVDTPNPRSSHSVTTPRGGGIGIVFSFIIGLILLSMIGFLGGPVLWALLGAGTSVALLGFLDDHGHISARWRLLVHVFAAIWGLYWLGGMPPLKIFGSVFELSVFGDVLAVLYLVWLLNLYNFMDGIDAIASVESICVCSGGAILYVFCGYLQLSIVPLVLASATAGFLCWNFPPARIFMGDTGSGFLGIILGIMTIQAAWIVPQLLWSWLILLGVFIVDATFTLLRRLLRGDKVYEAHRSHAYQYASRQYGKHLPVTLAVGAINLLWLLPIAIWVGIGRLDGAFGIAIAYIPLVILAIKYQAGKLEKPGS